MKIFLFIFSGVVLVSIASAQQFQEAIEDNSFFIEEAFNQEEYVVQHISTGMYSLEVSDFIYTFTQEWPVASQAHQLSYTLPYLSLNSGGKGLGDIILNYRYQLCAESSWAWISPRFSLILPTGNTSDNLGEGVVGYQINIPASKRLANEFIAHFNAGMTLYPNKKEMIGTTEVQKTLLSYFIGTSGIFLLNEHFNLMFEVLYSYSSGITEKGNVEYSGSTIVSPGFRYAINFGELQIVPGFALPIQFTSGTTDVSVYGYLSFEHPF